MWALNGSYLPGPFIMPEPKRSIFLPVNWGSSLSRGAHGGLEGFLEHIDELLDLPHALHPTRASEQIPQFHVDFETSGRNLSCVQFSTLFLQGSRRARA